MKTFTLLFALAALAGPAAAQQVETREGPVVGTANGPVNVYKGIAYAAPPVGALRWAPPAPAARRSAPFQASEYGHGCPQPTRPDRPAPAVASTAQSEDCLYLNVWTPAGARKAPVMVWIHGGAYRYGSGANPGYDGARFARDGVVVVTINYRLGALGFFAHPALTRAAGPGEPLGNYGIMDQQAALRWVQANIAAFGGDPANVTVFGESAGAGSILALLTAPSSKGLFAKAIVESGGGWQPPSGLTAAEARGAALAARAGLAGADATLDQLRAVDPGRLNDIPLTSGGFGPFQDGRLLKETVSQAFAAGHALDVPLIIGSNSFEASLMRTFQTPPVSILAKLTPEQRPLYPADDTVAAHTAYTDGAMGAPARWIAGKAATGAPSWLYHFSYVPTAQRATSPGASHASEIVYAFGNIPKANASPEDLAMEALLHSCWVAFAKAGRPTCQGGAAWPVYAPADDRLMEFGAPGGVRQHFTKARMDAFERASGH